MNYERIILELLERIQKLEEKVELLEKSNVKISIDSEVSNNEKMDIIDDINQKDIGLTQKARNYIMKSKEDARSRGQKEITLLCNDIQNALGVTNRTPCICTAMYDCMTNPNDIVLNAPRSGKSTTVLVKYYLDPETNQSGKITIDQLKTGFKEYFEKKKPDYKYPGPLYGMAFYITKHNIGVTLEELFSGKVSLDEYANILYDHFYNMDSSNPYGRTSAYKDAMKNLLEYVRDYHLENVKIEY